jgi:hypothetical protein
MERLQRLLNQGGMGGGGGGPAAGDAPQQDTAETVYVSSLALLKMLKHGRAGVPLEVMGLMLGEFVDEYTVKVVDVFAMPQVRGGGGRRRAGGGRSIYASSRICAAAGPGSASCLAPKPPADAPLYTSAGA